MDPPQDPPGPAPALLPGKGFGPLPSPVLWGVGCNGIPPALRGLLLRRVPTPNTYMDDPSGQPPPAETPKHLYSNAERLQQLVTPCWGSLPPTRDPRSGRICSHCPISSSSPLGSSRAWTGQRRGSAGDPCPPCPPVPGTTAWAWHSPRRQVRGAGGSPNPPALSGCGARESWICVCFLCPSSPVFPLFLSS